MASGSKLIVGRLIAVESGGWLNAVSDRIIIKLQVMVAMFASCSHIQITDSEDIH